jgi:hypothetical protein
MKKIQETGYSRGLIRLMFDQKSFFLPTINRVDLPSIPSLPPILPDRQFIPTFLPPSPCSSGGRYPNLASGRLAFSINPASVNHLSTETFSVPWS